MCSFVRSRNDIQNSKFPHQQTGTILPLNESRAIVYASNSEMMGQNSRNSGSNDASLQVPHNGNIDRAIMFNKSSINIENEQQNNTFYHQRQQDSLVQNGSASKIEEQQGGGVATINPSISSTYNRYRANTHDEDLGNPPFSLDHQGGPVSGKVRSTTRTVGTQKCPPKVPPKPSSASSNSSLHPEYENIKVRSG